MPEKEYHDEPGPEANRKQVMSEVPEHGSGTDVLFTRGAGNCVVMALYAQDTTDGYMLHVAAPGLTNTTELTLDAALAAAGGPGNLKITVRGASLQLPIGLESDENARIDEGTLAGRAHVEGLLESRGVRDADVVWSEGDVVVVDMELNCATGIVDIREFTTEDLGDG